MLDYKDIIYMNWALHSLYTVLAVLYNLYKLLLGPTPLCSARMPIVKPKEAPAPFHIQLYIQFSFS